MTAEPLEEHEPDLDELAEHWEQTWEQRAARWCPLNIVETAPVNSGRPPRMMYKPWRRQTRDIDLGATAFDENYWRCRDAGCRRFGGPFRSLMSAAHDGYEHARLHICDLLRAGKG